MNRERLNHLITILENVAPARFDLNEWKCGTTACAIGHACLDPELNRQGLYLERVAGDWGAWTPSYGDSRSWGAVQAFFDLNFSNTLHLFAHDSYHDEGEAPVRPQEVIARIQQFMKDNP